MKLIIEIGEYPKDGTPFTVGSTIKMPGIARFNKDGFVGHDAFSVRYYRNKREMLNRFEELSQRIEECVKDYYKEIGLKSDINLSTSSGNSEIHSDEPSVR